MTKNELINRLQGEIRTEFMVDYNKKGVLLYDFEDCSYIEDITDFLKENDISYKEKKEELLIFID